MAKIFVIIGKSGSGKNSVFNSLIQEARKNNLTVRTLAIGTTRPRRVTDLDGDYEFVTYDEFIRMSNDNLIAESRKYNTSNGVWTYFTKYDPKIHSEPNNVIYLTINTIDGYLGLVSTYGRDVVYPIYIKAPSDEERLVRMIAREQKEDNPNYTELYRRYNADIKDFSHSALVFAKISVSNRFVNNDLYETVQAILTRISDIVAGKDSYSDKFTEYLDKIIDDADSVLRKEHPTYMSGKNTNMVLTNIKDNYIKYMKRILSKMHNTATVRTMDEIANIFAINTFAKHSSAIVHIDKPNGTIRADNKLTVNLDCYSMIDSDTCLVILKEKLNCANELYKPISISTFDDHYVNHYLIDETKREYVVVYLNVPVTKYSSFMTSIRAHNNTLPIYDTTTEVCIDINYIK